jgi:hypothetical protein
MKFRTNLPESGGSNNYVKLKDKESITGVFRGDLHEFFVLWRDGKSSEVPEGTPGSKFRFRVNFVVREGASYVPKIFEQGQLVYEQLAEIHKEYPLEQTVCKITRNGEKLDTTYTIMPLRQPVTPEADNTMRLMKLLDLKSKAPAKQDQWADNGPEFQDERFGPPPEPYAGPVDQDELPF